MFGHGASVVTWLGRGRLGGGRGWPGRRRPGRRWLRSRELGGRLDLLVEGKFGWGSRLRGIIKISMDQFVRGRLCLDHSLPIEFLEVDAALATHTHRQTDAHTREGTNTLDKIIEDVVIANKCLICLFHP